MKAADTEYVYGSLTEFWKEQGVTPIPITYCRDEEQGFSWSEFINGLGRRSNTTEEQE